MLLHARVVGQLRVGHGPSDTKPFALVDDVAGETRHVDQVGGLLDVLSHQVDKVGTATQKLCPPLLAGLLAAHS